MTYYFPNVDPIYLYKRKGTEQDPYIFLRDTNNVVRGSIILKEVPQYTENVSVEDFEGNILREVETDTLAPDEFRIDYSVGIAYFNESLNGHQLTVSYWGTGYVNIPSTRIIVPNSDGDPVDTLQDALESVAEGIDTLGQVGNLDFKDEYNPNTQYKKWNFITFNNKTFVAKSDIQGLSPLETSEWALVSSGFGFTGIYNSNETYTVGDIVADPVNKNIYMSKVVENTSPLSDRDSWDIMLTLDDLVLQMDAIIQQLEDYQQTLEDSELFREQNELDRQDLFNDLVDDYESFYQLVQLEEQARDENEVNREISESTRNQMENTRQSQESTRENNENNRITAETVRTQTIENLVTEVQENIGGYVNEIEEKITELTGLRNTVSDLIQQTNNVTEGIDEVMFNIGEFRTIGEFDIELPYRKYNIVSVNGSSYIAKTDTEGNAIDDEEFWFCLSQKGMDNLSITIEGVTPDESGNINLNDLNVVRQEDFVEEIGNIVNEIGDLSRLRTTRKDSIVDAINELKTRIDDIVDILT